MSEVYEIINKLISEVTGEDRKRQPSERIKEDIGLDSLSIVNVIIYIETKLDIFFDDAILDPENLKTLGDLVNMTEQYLK